MLYEIFDTHVSCLRTSLIGCSSHSFDIVHRRYDSINLSLGILSCTILSSKERTLHTSPTASLVSVNCDVIFLYNSNAYRELHAAMDRLKNDIPPH